MTSGWLGGRWRYLQVWPMEMRGHVPLLIKSKHSDAPGPGSSGIPGGPGAGAISPGVPLARAPGASAASGLAIIA
eukprot:3298905-Prymnesium_polylepis.1